MNIALSVILLGISIIAVAFCSVSEVSFNMSNRNRLEKGEDSEKTSERLAAFVVNHYNHMIITILIITNIASFVASTVTTLFVLNILAEIGISDSVTATIATVVTSVVILIFGEIVPKSIAGIRPEKIARMLSVVLRALMFITYPLVFIINKFIKLFTARVDDNSDTVTQDELLTVLETGENEGSIDETRSELIQSAIDFKYTSVRQVLVPRVDLVAIDIEDDIDSIIKLCFDTIYSRIPVYKESTDNIIGLLNVNRFYKTLVNTDKTDIKIEDLLTEPCYLYESVKLPVALDILREDKKHMAVVVDEYGGTQGIVTMEDILEELVGDIFDETENEEYDIVDIGNNCYKVDGYTTIDDLFDYLGKDSEILETECTSVGGWVVELFERFPKAGESVKFHNMQITVVEMSDHRVNQLNIVVEPEEKNEEEQ